MIQRSAKVECPVCGALKDEAWINAHLDQEHFNPAKPAGPKLAAKRAAKPTFVQASVDSFCRQKASVKAPEKVRRFFTLASQGGDFMALFQPLKASGAIVSEFTFKLVQPRNAPLNPFCLCASTSVPLTRYFANSFRGMLGRVFASGLASGYTNLPLLKSHLQKTIRRQRSDLAQKTSFEIIHVSDTIESGLSELLRRLFVIMIEDVSLIEDHASVLAWFMVHVARCQSAAGKSMEFESLSEESWTHFSGWLFRFVDLLCRWQTRDFPSDAKSRLGYSLGEAGFLETVHALSLKQASTIYALLLRAEYGGMADDKDMLIQSAMIWTERYSNDSVPMFETRASTKILTAADLKLGLDEWELAAIDFHVSPISKRLWNRMSTEHQTWLLQSLSEKDGIESVSVMIWTESSSKNDRQEPMNYKKKLKTGNTEQEAQIKKLWTQYRETFQELARSYLRENAYKKSTTSF